MIRRPPRSTLDRSSAASDVYKRQILDNMALRCPFGCPDEICPPAEKTVFFYLPDEGAVSYTHLRAHETVLDLVCRLLLEKKKTIIYNTTF